MRAEIISVGTELLLGEIVDTNASFLAQRLPPLGIDLFYVSQVGDNLGRLADAIRRGLERSDLVITTGGLGPTEDDLTREAIAEVFGERMAVQPELERTLRGFFERRGRRMPERNLKQATTIPSGTFIPNPVGTAPGWWVERGEKLIVSMPGVPSEMYTMWEEQVVPRLARRIGVGVLATRTLKLIGIGESHAEEALGDLVRSANPSVATYAKSDGVHVRMAAKASTRAEAERLLAEAETRVRGRVDEWVYGDETASFPAAVGSLLRQRALSLAVAESATGGHLAGLITDAPGASDYFRAGYVAYTRAAKEALGVPADVLDAHGTLSAAAARALATAARERAAANVGIGTTGVAGPGPVDEVPEGTLHMAVDLRGRVVAVSTRYSTSRAEYKRRGALEALGLLWRLLREGEGGSSGDAGASVGAASSVHS